MLAALLICLALSAAAETEACPSSESTNGLHMWQLQTDQCAAPTCYSEGRMVYMCSYCYQIKQDFTAKTAHTWQVVSTVPATCTTDGSQSLKCTVCDEPQQNTIPATGHTWVASAEAMPATCTMAGKKATEKCSVCGLERGGESIPALGHDWGEDAIVVEATCGAAGKKRPAATAA